ncbi:MAG TPA: type II toxin-antitoxin system RelE/ParE family toxin [Beijerinckiaceae bacterium]|jgi:addiction module RelE/StbE family toxin
MRLVVTEVARRDIDEIGSYITRDDPDAAERIVLRLEERCLSLLLSPFRYPLTLRYPQRGIRRMAVGSYIVFYRVRSSAIEILRVLHQARDYERLLFR